MIANDISKIPQTIISRCQLIKFLPVASHKIEKYLKKFEVSEDQINEFSRIACGIPGKAVELLHNDGAQKSYFENINIFNNLLKSDIFNRLKLADETIAKYLDADTAIKILNDWLKAARDLLLLTNANESLITNFQTYNQDFLVSNNLRNKKVFKIISRINFAKEKIRQNVAPKNAIENLIINL